MVQRSVKGTKRKTKGNWKCINSNSLGTVVFSCDRKAEEILDILSTGKGHRAT